MAKNTELLDKYESPTVLTYGERAIEFEPSYWQTGSGENYDGGSGPDGPGPESSNLLSGLTDFLKRMFGLA